MAPATLGLLLCLAGPPAAGTPSDPPGGPPAAETPPPARPRCEGAAWARPLGLSPRHWLVACVALGGGQTFVAAVPDPISPDGRQAQKRAALPAVIAIGREGEIAERASVTIDQQSGTGVAEVLRRSDEWLLTVERLALGTGEGVRVGVFGHWGKDPFVAREVALLVRVAGAGAPRLLWSGVGNGAETHGDVCRVDTVVTFALVDEDRAVERRPRVSSSYQGGSPAARRKRGKDCVAKEQPPQRFPIGP